MRRRGAASLVVALALLAPVAAADVAPGGTFVDDDGSVHEPAIEALVDAGITSGCSTDGPRFCPDDPVTRGQMAAFLRRSLNLPTGSPSLFEDTVGSAYSVDIDAVRSAGITAGCSGDGDRFCPDHPVTRGQMAAFLARGLDLPPAPPAAFTDTAGSVFAGDIARVAAAGITVGCDPPGNERFCPDVPVTRAQMASFLVRALDLATSAVPARPATVDVVSRESWGADAPRGGFATHTVERLTIHHSGPPASVISGPAAFRSWQAYHFSLGWPDLAYHFIVGRDGRVYEGRPFTAVGDTATDYDPTGHFLVVVEGDYESETLSSEQFESLARLLAWVAVEFDVFPDTIAGHRDHASTTCPGDNIERFIEDGTLRDRVEELIAAGGVGYRAAGP